MRTTYREKSGAVSCVTSGVTVNLYTCPTSAVSHVPLLFINNVGSTVSVQLALYKASSTSSFQILSGKNLTTGEFLQLSDETGLILEAGDRLDITPTGTTVSVDAFCTILEHFKPIG